MEIIEIIFIKTNMYHSSKPCNWGSVASCTNDHRSGCSRYLQLGLKRTYSSACVELLAVEMKLKRRKTRSGTPRSWVSCLWMICSLNDICCCVFLRNRYQPMTFWIIVQIHENVYLVQLMLHNLSPNNKYTGHEGNLRFCCYEVSGSHRHGLE